MKEYSIEEIKRVVRPQLGEDIPLTLYRILRVIGMRKSWEKHQVQPFT